MSIMFSYLVVISCDMMQLQQALTRWHSCHSQTVTKSRQQRRQQCIYQGIHICHFNRVCNVQHFLLIWIYSITSIVGYLNDDNFLIVDFD